MTRLKNYLIILIIGIIINSDYCSASLLLEQGQAAPSKGLLFSLEEAQKIKNDLEQYELEKDINLSLIKTIGLYKMQIDNHKEINDILKSQNDELAGMLGRSKSITDWQRIGYFTLGIVTSVAIVYATKKAVN